MRDAPDVCAVDLFCGAGGLAQGLHEAGIAIAAGIDLDPSCKPPFEANIHAPFLEKDVANVTAEHLRLLWGPDRLRLLAGCAPCQPFSPHRRGADTTEETSWSLLEHFSRLVRDALPEFVTMENVPRLASASVFRRFVADLRSQGYYVDWSSSRAVDYGLPQARRRIVLLASRLGPISIPSGDPDPARHKTVRQAIGGLAPLAAGAADTEDELHRARALEDVNLRRMQHSRPGGTWRDWPEDLRAPCHRRASGSTFANVYARMEWDKPSPTITTLAHNFGTGRFGHPEQDRAISLREAAILQGFPSGYSFVTPGTPVHFSTVGRLIGNAVPPPLARAIGNAFLAHAYEHASTA